MFKKRLAWFIDLVYKSSQYLPVKDTPGFPN